MLEHDQPAQVLRIATARIDHKAAAGERLLDITVKSASGVGRLMAPEWQPVLAFKEGRIDWAAYTEKYHKLLQQRYAQHAGAFHELIGDSVRNNQCLVLACYCNVDSGCGHCHRFLMADYLGKIARAEGFEVTNLGELPRRLSPKHSQQLELPI